MGAAVEITRSDHNAAALRGLAAKSNDAAQVRRLLALALILEGHPRREAAERSGMDRQTLRDWVHRYNDQGAGPREEQSGALAPRRSARGGDSTIHGHRDRGNDR